MIAEEKKIYYDVPKFSGANVPVELAAKVMRKDKQFVRQGILQGLLKFGVAFKKEGSNQYDYYISPMKFWQETGFIYDELPDNERQKKPAATEQAGNE